MQKKKIIRNIIIFIFFITITFLLIFKNYDLKQTITIIREAKLKYVLLAFFVMFLSIVFESINIKNILGLMNRNISILSSIRYTLIDFFFSGITPGGGGGQPMEVYYMKKDKIPVSSSAVALLIEVCSFHLITIILSIIGFVFYHNLLNKGLFLFFFFGLLFRCVLFVLMFISLFSHKVSTFIAKAIIKVLERIKYRNLNDVRKSIKEVLDQYYNCALFIKKNNIILLQSLFWVFLQITMNYLVIFFVYKSFGLHGYNFMGIIIIQAIMAVSTSSVPLPGAVGISETAFLMIYTKIFGSNLLASSLIISRGINFYIFIIISLIIVIYSTIKKGRRNKL